MPLGGAGAYRVSKGVAVYNDADISIPTGNWTRLTFNSERWDDADFHSIVTNTGRLTVPQGYSGHYTIAGIFYFNNSALGSYRQGAIKLNGTTYLAIFPCGFGAAFNSYILVGTPYYLSDNGAAANDYVEIFALQDTGGALLVRSSGNYSPEFRMVRMP